MDTITSPWKQNWNGFNVSNIRWKFSRNSNLKMKKKLLSGLPIVPSKFIHHLHEFDGKKLPFGVGVIGLERIVKKRGTKKEQKECVHFWSISVKFTSPRNNPKFGLDLLSFFIRSEPLNANSIIPIRIGTHANAYELEQRTESHSLFLFTRIMFTVIDRLSKSVKVIHHLILNRYRSWNSRCMGWHQFPYSYENINHTSWIQMVKDSARAIFTLRHNGRAFAAVVTLVNCFLRSLLVRHSIEFY